MSRFEMTVTLRRTMTPDEARARAVSMELPKGALSFIVNEFREHDADSRRQGEGYFIDDEGRCWCVGDAQALGVGEEGRLALGSECAYVFSDLSSLPASLCEGISDEMVGAVFNEFFEE